MPRASGTTQYALPQRAHVKLIRVWCIIVRDEMGDVMSVLQHRAQHHGRDRVAFVPDRSTARNGWWDLIDKIRMF